MTDTTFVAAKLAGGGTLYTATAGKPDCYTRSGEDDTNVSNR